MNKICILDYGSGNVKSVFNMVSIINDNVVISNKEKDMLSSSHIILPGVGAFGAAMDKIRKRIHLPILEDEILRKKKPFLGICVGMQVLASKGFEFGEHDGLNWITGKVKKMKVFQNPLPHIGWNNIKIQKNDILLNEIPNNSDFYFVHSYAFEVEDNNNQIAVTEYDKEFCSIIKKENIYGIQFHPEKSQEAGKLLLTNFLNL